MALAPPMDVEQVANPTKEQVQELHDKYCKALSDLFDRHKGKMGWDHKTLHFEDENLYEITANERAAKAASKAQ